MAQWLNKYRNILIFLLAYFAGFLCSRGKDGQLFSGIFLHCFLLILLIWFSYLNIRQFKSIIITAMICLIGSFLGILTYSDLDEMAGLLFIVFPFFSFLYFIIFTLIFLFFRKIEK